MKILVTGGSGFIGSHLADTLVEAGHQVRIFDKRPSPWLREGQEMFQGDILDLEACKRAAQGREVIFHLAGIPHLDLGIRDPIGTVYLNVLGTVHMLEAARLGGARRFVYASSVYVYSEGGSFYRCSKQAAELYVEEYQRLYGLPFTILRYGTLYGPRADDHNSIRRYLKQAYLQRKIVATGSEDVLREYIHVRDAAQSCLRILEPEFENQHIVLTGHHPMRFSDLLKTIQEIVGRDVSIEMRPPDPQKIEHGISGHYNITPYAFRPKVARKLTNNPYVDLGQGLIECLEDIHREQLQAQKEEPAEA